MTRPQRIFRLLLSQGSCLSSGIASHAGRAVIFASLLAVPVVVDIHAQPPAASITRSYVTTSVKTPDCLGRLHSGEAVSRTPDHLVVLTNVSLRYLIWNAYGLQGYQVVGGPDWIDSDGYDVKVPEESAQAWVREVLGDRFHLKFHRESRVRPAYDLVIGGNIKLAEPRARTCLPYDASSPDRSAPLLPPCDRVFFSSGPVYKYFDNVGPVSGVAGQFWAGLDGERASIGSFCVALSDILGRKVFDKTGLDGAFDIHLKFYLGDELAGLEGPDARLGEHYHEIQSAHQPHLNEVLAKLGLALQSEIASDDILVVDHVQKWLGH